MIKTRIIFPNGAPILALMVGPPAVNEPIEDINPNFIVGSWALRPEHEADEDGCWMVVTMVEAP